MSGLYGLPPETYCYLDDNTEYPNGFSGENLRDVDVRNEIYDELVEKADDNNKKALISEQEAQNLLNKVSSEVATIDETMDLIDYILRKQFKKENNNLLGNLVEYDPDDYDEDDDETNINDDDYESAKDIYDWIAMEEEGTPLPDPFKVSWEDIENGMPSPPRYYFECNETQLKNRIKLAYFLDLVLDSPYLEIPPSEQEVKKWEQERAESADEEVPF